MNIQIISDVHNRWDDLVIPPCDILISCGDFSFVGEVPILIAFHKWLDKQPAKHIISIPGNHEIFETDRCRSPQVLWPVAKDLVTQVAPRIHFLTEGRLELNGTKFWCSSWTPYFHNWGYNAEHGEAIAQHWDAIPVDTQVLVTHGPPHGILDMVLSYGVPKNRAGCAQLASRIGELKELKLHCFGHIHEGSGVLEQNGVTYINASICDERYDAVHPVREYNLKEVIK